MNLHTPIPWRLRHRSGELGRSQVLGPPHPVDGGDYAALATLANPEDAEFICLAVNQHAALVAALRKTHAALLANEHALAITGNWGAPEKSAIREAEAVLANLDEQ